MVVVSIRALPTVEELASKVTDNEPYVVDKTLAEQVVSQSAAVDSGVLTTQGPVATFDPQGPLTEIKGAGRTQATGLNKYGFKDAVQKTTRRASRAIPPQTPQISSI